MTKLSMRIAALGAAAVLLMGQAMASTSTPPRLTAPVNATKFSLDPGRTYSAPVFIVDPENSNTVLASYVEMRSKRCGLLRSNDGGQTWKALDQFPALTSYPFCFTSNGSVLQTPLAFGRHHTLYYAFAGWDNQDNPRSGNVSVQLARSSNLGDSWQTVLVRDARGKQGDDQENNRPVQGVAVDTSHGAEDIVYVAWRQDHRQPQAPNARPELPALAISRDGGKSFGDPVILANGVWTDEVKSEALKTTTTTTAAPTTTTTAPAQTPVTTPTAPTTVPATPSTPPDPKRDLNFGGGNPFVTLDGKGTVYVVWPSRATNIPGGVAPAIFLSKSTDQGKTFTTSQVAPFKRGNPGFGSLRMVWSPQGGPDGTLHLISEGTNRPEINGELDVFYRRSTDGGKTWTEKILNDDDPKDFYFQFDPNISIAPNGRLDAAWWDTRVAAGTVANDVFYTTSSDNGLTWSKNTRITDRSVDRTVGVWLNNFNVDSQPGLISLNAYALVGWDDTRNTDKSVKANTELGAGVQDVFVSAVQYQSLGGGTSRAAKIALAGALGLVAVGLVLAGAALTNRKRGSAVLPGLEDAR